MDIFKQDWNKQIKTNPFVNKLLNNYPVDYENKLVSYTMAEWEDIPFVGGVWKNPKHAEQQELKPYDIKYTKNLLTGLWEPEYFETNFSQWVKKGQAPDNMQDRVDGLFYILPETYKEEDGRTEPKLHANTRPFSLYNLKYAALR